MTVLLHQQGEASQGQTAGARDEKRGINLKQAACCVNGIAAAERQKKSPLAGAQKYRHSISCQRQVPSLMTIGTLGWSSDHGKAMIRT